MVSKQRKDLQFCPLRFDTILPPWQNKVAECSLPAGVTKRARW
jgi:hypothetical protein